MAILVCSLVWKYVDTFGSGWIHALENYEHNLMPGFALTWYSNNGFFFFYGFWMHVYVTTMTFGVVNEYHDKFIS